MATILVMGSVARDEVVRLEEPLRIGGHLQGRPAEHRLGGGGANTAVALAGAGHRAMLVAPVGDDATGESLRSELAALGVDVSQVREVRGPSTRSILLVDPEGERTIVNLSRAREAGVPDRIRAVKADFLYVRNRSLDLAPLLSEMARSCTVVAHLPPIEPGAFPAQVLVASDSDLPPEVAAAPLEAARSVAGGLLRWVVVTHGERGATAFGADGTILEAMPPRVDALDSTGAGDAFAAGFLHGLASGGEMAATLDVACAWGAEAVRWETSALPSEAVGRLL